MFRTGQTIGQYTLINQLGRGGFGEVWLAEKRTKFVTTRVAVKLPLDEQVDHDTIKHEATLWQQASGHPNILPIIDADEYDGQIVIVSEYAPDGSLEQLLKKHGKLEIKQAVEMTIGILNGLEFLHSRNIIHRDLKPANILLQGETPRLADFGISRAMRATMTSQSQNISGTFHYMSPEALDGKRSVQTDIWAVGVNLYQFLTGTLPFPQKEPSVLFPAIIMREFAALPDSIPQSLKNAVAKALAKLPENSYASASEMHKDLQQIPVNISFPQFAPPKVLHKPILVEKITASATFESKTATNETEQKTAVNAKSDNHLTATKSFYAQDSIATQIKEKQTTEKTQPNLEQQSEAEIEQQNELERKHWQAVKVERKEEIKPRNQEETKRKKVEREKRKRNKENNQQWYWKLAVIGVGAFTAVLLGILILTVSSNLPSNVTNNNTPLKSSSNSNLFKNSIGMEFVKIPAGTFMMGSGDSERREAFRVAELMSWDASLDWFKDEGHIHNVIIS